MVLPGSFEIISASGLHRVSQWAALVRSSALVAFRPGEEMDKIADYHRLRQRKPRGFSLLAEEKKSEPETQILSCFGRSRRFLVLFLGRDRLLRCETRSSSSCQQEPDVRAGLVPWREQLLIQKGQI